MIDVAERVLHLAESLNIELQAVHVKGELNVLADMLSRQNVVLKNEWRLVDRCFEWICKNSLWGPPTIDMFANRLNTQLQRFISPCEDDKAVGVDALVCRWPDEVCYAFPPTTIMDRMIVKMLQEKPRKLLLVAPYWPTTSWFPVLQQWCLKREGIPEVSLIQPHWNHLHPNPELLSLALWHIHCQD